MVAPSAKDKHDILKAFTTSLRAKVKHMPKFSIHLESYPAKPENLPQELYNAAYSDEKPSEKGVTMMGVQAHVVPYRDTHSMVRSAKPSGSSAMSSESFCMQFMHAVSKMMQGQGGCQDGLPGLEVFASKRKNKALANAPSATGESAGSKPALEDRKAEEHKKPQEEQPAEEQEQKGLFDLKLPEGKQPADPKDQLDAMVGTFNARSKARKIEREEEKDTSPNEAPHPRLPNKHLARRVRRNPLKKATTWFSKAAEGPPGRANLFLARWQGSSIRSSELLEGLPLRGRPQ